MITKTLYAVTKNSDQTEGRGHSIIIAYAESKDLALQIVEDKRFAQYCVMGYHQPGNEYNKYAVEEHFITVVDSVDDFYNVGEEKARQKALSKLTTEERKLLGL